MLELLRRFLRPRAEYHVEYFRGSLGMCGYHDKKRFSTLGGASKRLEELAAMSKSEVVAELGFEPSFMRVVMVENSGRV